MEGIRGYIRLSKAAEKISLPYTDPGGFIRNYNDVYSVEKNSVLRHFIANGTPYLFRTKPILYEQVVQYIADRVEISAIDIKVIGSAKTGFSISPAPDYGRKFGTHSDIDFSLIDQTLFEKLRHEFEDWSTLFLDKTISPYNKTEESYWIDNLEKVPRKLKRGFIDTNLIPNRANFPLTRRINNCLWLLKETLFAEHGIEVKKVSASVYKNGQSFIGRLSHNTETVMKNLK